MTDESPKEEILINVTPSEVRAALLENGVLQEIYIERAARRGVISNIYKGRVSRVLPGMQAAFVDIGLQRTAFLHVSDIVQSAERRRGKRRICRTFVIWSKRERTFSSRSSKIRSATKAHA